MRWVIFFIGLWLLGTIIQAQESAYLTVAARLEPCSQCRTITNLGCKFQGKLYCLDCSLTKHHVIRQKSPQGEEVLAYPFTTKKNFVCLVCKKTILTGLCYKPIRNVFCDPCGRPYIHNKIIEKCKDELKTVVAQYLKKPQTRTLSHELIKIQACPICKVPVTILCQAADQLSCLTCSLQQLHEIQDESQQPIVQAFASDKPYTCQQCQKQIETGFWYKPHQQAHCFTCGLAALPAEIKNYAKLLAAKKLADLQAQTTATPATDTPPTQPRNTASQPIDTTPMPVSTTTGYWLMLAVAVIGIGVLAYLAVGGKETPEELGDELSEAASKPEVDENRPLTLTTLTDAFHDEVEPVPTSIWYRVAFICVAVFIVALPIIYFAIILGTAYGVFYHATHNLTVFQQETNVKAGLFVYITPLVTGVILILLMLKPLFAKHSSVPTPFSLRQGDAPLLFAFIRKICEALQAPFPGRIDITWDTNASAHLRTGAMSLFQKDLVLTLGLPLIAGLNLRQLAAIIAHEFGHFAQGAGMGFTYIIQSINDWLRRMVYQRDDWDDQLVIWSGYDVNFISIMAYVARICIWTVRRVLWILMTLADAMTCFLLRQMEYDADRYAARLAGSEVFVTTMRRLRLLTFAEAVARQDLSQTWRDGKLSDNYPLLVVSYAEQLQESAKAIMLKMEKQESTGLFHTHPSDQDRFLSVQEEAAPGIFHLEVPAHTILGNFTGLSQHVSLFYYRRVLGPHVGKDNLIATEAKVERQKQRQQKGKEIERYFWGKLSPLCPFFLPYAQLPESIVPETLLQTLQDARKKMKQLSSKTEEAYQFFLKNDTRIHTYLCAITVLEAGLPINPADCNLKEGTLAEAQQAFQYRLAERLQLRQSMEEFFQVAQIRLWSALQLAYLPELEAKIPDIQTYREQIPNILATQAELQQQFGYVAALRRDYQVFAVLAQNAAEQQHDPQFTAMVDKQMALVHDHLLTLATGLNHITYPWELEENSTSLKQYALGQMLPLLNVQAVYDRGSIAVERLFVAYLDLIARLVTIAEQVESTLGVAASK